jgi:voltage-gated potassium channel
MGNALLNRLRQRKYLVLLLTVASTIIVQPLAHGFLAGLILYEALRNLLVVTVLFIVFQRRHVRLVSLLVGLPVIASNWAHYTVPEGFEPALAVIHHAFLVAFLGFAVAVILRRIFERKVVGDDDVLGAICGYMLAGIAWGSLYLLVELLVPGSFSVHQAIAGQLGSWYSRQSLFDYYSLMTLTTIGYSDITPTRPPAISLTWMEAMFGQFYIAVIVAQLVGLGLAEVLQPSAPKST